MARELSLKGSGLGPFGGELFLVRSGVLKGFLLSEEARVMSGLCLRSL